METQGSFMTSEGPFTGLYPEPVESSAYHHTSSFRYILISSYPLLPRGLFPLVRKCAAEMPAQLLSGFALFVVRNFQACFSIAAYTLYNLPTCCSVSRDILLRLFRPRRR